MEQKSISWKAVQVMATIFVNNGNRSAQAAARASSLSQVKEE
jgi:hypothetical protein